MQLSIRRAQSCAEGAREAVEAFHAGVAQAKMALVVFFCASDYDLDAIAAEMRQRFAGVPVIGCTTAGEIGPAGYCEHSLSGASFAAADFRVACGCLDELHAATPSRCQALTSTLMRQLERQGGTADENHCFAWTMIDGLSVREESIVRFMQSAFGNIPLLGGSAGDGGRFGRTAIYCDGYFRSDRAVFALIATDLPFRLIKTQGIEATEERLVVTEALPEQRIVKEINGLPAAGEYARVLDTAVSRLTDEIFMQHPLVAMINGVCYARSIQRVNADGSLQLYCAIDNGLVLRVGRCAGLADNLDSELAAIDADIGTPQIILAGDCVHRKLEMACSPDRQRVEELLQRHHVTGFGTYGEQYRGIHINQTFVGVAIGSGGTLP
ncbi:Uncharacterized conserved protein, contains FIST_N domain [Propionivibrio dicarboxylicus]|uniref:Uncharacterized conserved protein, contains FIST_N domain n=2 Tax=Propionivibrio dicarboxylicus TaxID=83767 RepID=A0A1G8BE05_9RHOO|nr:Uncharacterized conserved protein, contains FIST_N domain [Propionivibrio dicarboxylicus]